MDQLYALRAFVAVVQHGSFSKAAASLNVTPGAISKAISTLEASIQTRVLHRTTRSVSLTEDAKPYYLTCRRLLEELDEANRRIGKQREIDSGSLRLVVHPMLISETLTRLVRSYHAIAPDVNLKVSVQEDAVNPYDGRFDMAILPSHLVEHSIVIRRMLSRSPRVLVASPGYLEYHGTPKAASDLANHFMLLSAESRKRDTDFIDLLEHGKRVSVSPRSSVVGNETLLRATALNGTGIASLPEAMVREDIAAGNLTHILSHCTTADSDVEICLFYPHRELLPARFRIFVDLCTEFFRSTNRNIAGNTEPGPQHPGGRENDMLENI
jgi:DNA-binding transcriptional LysR family regulator